MFNSLSGHRRLLGMGLGVFLALAIPAGIGIWWHDSKHRAGGTRPVNPVLRELTLAELVKQNGKLYAPAESTPFDGLLYENFPGSKRKLEIEIHDGQADGRAVGYFENGKLEVEEFFTAGVSHGLRTRWDREGWKKSQEQIEHGKLNGPHLEWHANGTMAVSMTLKDNQPEGLAEAWYPDGSLKSRTHFVAGKIVKREYFPTGT
jgi:antitoxin component YwqK of YwqJK toxin-antitoxin module